MRYKQSNINGKCSNSISKCAKISYNYLFQNIFRSDPLCDKIKGNRVRLWGDKRMRVEFGDLSMTMACFTLHPD